MRTRGTAGLALLVFGMASCASSGTTPRAIPGGESRLVRFRDEPGLSSRTLLDVLQTRLPVVVQHGRFSTVDGITSTCVHGRRSVGLSAHSIDAMTGLPTCNMAVAYVNRIRVADVGRFLSAARVEEFDSVELLSATESLQRYGLASDGGDVLVLWTRGRSRLIE